MFEIVGAFRYRIKAPTVPVAQDLILRSLRNTFDDKKTQLGRFSCCPRLAEPSSPIRDFLQALIEARV
jgi:hypothetical protein